MKKRSNCSNHVRSIDGVLFRGSEPHPSANKALTKLQENDIPFILLTNGGGLSDAARCENLSSKLDFPIAPSQLVQSHTPAKSLAETYETILVVGGEGENCRHIAEEYGFKNVFIPDDFYATDPGISPFSPSPPPIYARNVPKGTKIDAIFVFNDPRDWALSIQLIVDLLRSANGVYGTLAEPESKGHVPIFFTNNDLVWANQYDIPRLGQGAFRTAVQAVFQRFPESSKRSGLSNTLGKPTHGTFRYAQKLLMRDLIAKLKETSPELEFNEEVPLEPAKVFRLPAAFAGTPADTATAGEATPPPPADPVPAATPAGESSSSTAAEAANQPFLRPPKTPSILQRVYMVGDNPESDMAGLKRAGYRGTTWWGLLVRSGVWREPQNPKYPIAIVGDVLAAVDWAMENEQKINDGVALEAYPRYLQNRWNLLSQYEGTKIYTPGSGKAGAGAAMSGRSAGLEEKPDHAMEEARDGGALGKKKVDGESNSDSD